MKVRALCVQLALLTSPLVALAAEGLVSPTGVDLWPQWQARIAVQATAVSPLNSSRWLDTASTQQGLQGAAVLGDYYFAQPWFGKFRASGGVMFGATGGAQILSASVGSQLGLSLRSKGQGLAPGNEASATVPYLGMGFSTAAWRDSLSFSADIGWVSDQPSVSGGGRAIFGNQGREAAWRELRVSPVLSLGLSYRF